VCSSDLSVAECPTRACAASAAVWPSGAAAAQVLISAYRGKRALDLALGTAFLVAVDIRKGSHPLGKWVGETFSADNHRQQWAPPGFARGFCVLSSVAQVEYLCTAEYNATGESGIRWNDPRVGIEWPVTAPILSGKDASAQTLDEWLARAESDNFAAPSVSHA